MRLSHLLSAAAFSVLVAACARTQSQLITGPAGVTTTRAAVERARMDSARLPYTKADVAFMTGMIAHHAQAIVMSNLVPTRSSNTSVRTLAERIINAQEDEIVSMQRWLLNRGQEVPDPKSGTHSMSAHDHNMPGMAMPNTAMPNTAMPNTAMPGMLSAAQLAKLDSARGPIFDELFLTYMIQHHGGAVSMVKDLFNSPGAGQDETVFKFASDVNVDQTTEIARMERMLVFLRMEKKLP